jgi:hypothetical protein
VAAAEERGGAMDDGRSGAITYTILIMTDWSGFKMFFFRHGCAMAWRGWPSMFQDSVKPR